MSTLPSALPDDLSDFHFESILGEGAMGVVYRAYQKSLDRQVAIKVLRPELVHDAQFVERLAREARAAASLDHPHLVRAFAVGHDGDTHYIAMDLVEGQTAADAVQDGRLDPKRAIEIGVAVADALAYGHERGLVHRDVKPSNILLGGDGAIKLTDLGLSKRTVAEDETLSRPGTTLGTPTYMAPEQIRDASSVGPPSDVYALAATIAHLLTGVSPFRGATLLEMLSAKESGKVALDGIDGGLAELLRSALDADPAARPSAAALGAQLVAGSSASGTDSRVSPTRSPRSRWTGLVLASLLIAGLGYFALERSDGGDRAVVESRQVAESPQADDAANQASALSVPSEEKAIVVLPFENLSPDPDNAFFASGVYEDVVAKLAKMKHLAVISTRTAEAVAADGMRISEIADELRVSHVMEGSVRRAGDRVRIRVELIDAQRDQQQWSETYDRELSDVLEIQSEVALEVASALEVQLSPETREQVASVGTENLEAYELVLRARANYPSREATELLERAIEMDPDYRGAYGLLAANLALTAEKGDEQARKRAIEAAETALALSAGESGHGPMGLVEARWGGITAEEELVYWERELANGSTDPFTWRRYLDLLLVLGRSDEALDALRRAVRLNPRSPLLTSRLANRLLSEGTFDEGVPLALMNAELHPDFGPALASALMAEFLTDRISTYRRLSEALRDSDGKPSDELVGLIAVYLYRAGADEEAAAWLDWLGHLPGLVWPSLRGDIYDSLGHPDEAIAWLDGPVWDGGGGLFGYYGATGRIERERLRARALRRLATSAYAQGDAEEGQALGERAVDVGRATLAEANELGTYGPQTVHHWIAISLAIALRTIGRDEEAADVLDEIQKHLDTETSVMLTTQAGGMTFIQGCVRAMRGDLDGAVEAFEQAREQGLDVIWPYEVFPLQDDPLGVFNGIGEHAGFQTMLASIEANAAELRAQIQRDFPELLTPPPQKVNVADEEVPELE